MDYLSVGNGLLGGGAVSTTRLYIKEYYAVTMLQHHFEPNPLEHADLVNPPHEIEMCSSIANCLIQTSECMHIDFRHTRLFDDVDQPGMSLSARM